MEIPDVTPRTVAVYLIQGAISMKVTQIARDTMVDNTRFENDDIIVKLGSGAVGMVAAGIVKPHTEKAVDKIADYLVAKRKARKKAQQEDTSETEK
jgi:hypothetical protein